MSLWSSDSYAADRPPAPKVRSQRGTAEQQCFSVVEEFEKLPIVAALLSSTGPLAVVGVSQRSRRKNRYKSAPLALCGACTHMHALTLRAEEAEEFDGRRAGSPEPVRDAGVELGRLTRSQQKVVLAENNPQLAAQDVQPLVALVHLQVRFLAGATRGDDQLVRLQPARTAGEWQHRHPVAGKGLCVDAWIAGRRCADQLIERDLVGLGERQEQLEVRPALSRLEPRERADRDTRRSREIGQGHVALLAQGAQPRPNRGQDLVK